MKWSEVEKRCLDMVAGQMPMTEWCDFVDSMSPRQLRMLVALLSGACLNLHRSVQNFRSVLMRPVSSTSCPHPCQLIEARPR